MPLILGTNSIKDTGYDVANSLRFDDGDSAYLERNFSTTQDSRRKFTFSAWVKRGNLTTSTNIWGSSEGSGEGYNSLKFENHKLQYLSGNTSNSGTQVNLETNRLFRDVSSWYHIVLAVDTSQGTDTNRIKLYVNNSQETSFNTSTYPSQDTDLLTSTTPQMTIGMRDLRGTNAQFWDGYMCEVVFIDNQQLTPTSFGEFDSDSPNVWKPIDVSGLTFGTGGYYLEFKQSGTSQNSSGLGADTSGNNQHFATSGLASTDQSTDTCTNNFATLNSLHNLSGTLSEGNLKYATSVGYGSYSNTATSTIGVSSGRWYAEFKCGGTSGSYPNGMVGVYYDQELFQNGKTNPAQSDDEGWGYAENGNIYNNSSTGTGTTYTNGDIIGVFLDCEGDKVYFYKNGSIVNSGGTSIDAGKTYFFFIADTSGSGSTTFEANFGSPTFSISSTNADGNGYGSFEYEPVISSVNYYSLNTKNLAEFG